MVFLADDAMKLQYKDITASVSFCSAARFSIPSFARLLGTRLPLISTEFFRLICYALLQNSSLTCITCGAGTRCREFFYSSTVRTDAQSRAELECPRARVPYVAGWELPLATTMRAHALPSNSASSLAAYGHSNSPSEPPRLPAEEEPPLPSTARTRQHRTTTTVTFSADTSIPVPSIEHTCDCERSRHPNSRYPPTHGRPTLYCRPWLRIPSNRSACTVGGPLRPHVDQASWCHGRVPYRGFVPRCGAVSLMPSTPTIAPDGPQSSRYSSAPTSEVEDR